METSESYKCEFVGCGKAFKRQVHLTRHERSHDPKHLHICQFCNKEFNRKDSLRRHVVLHAEASKPTLSGKVKSACIACRAGKIRCDGNEKCSRCLKKAIDCKYPGQDDDTQMEESSEDLRGSINLTGSQPLPIMEQYSAPPGENLSTNNSHGSISSSQFPDQTSSLSSSIVLGPAIQPRAISSIPIPPKINGLINWLSIRIEKDPDVHSANMNQVEVRPDPSSKLYLDTYFNSFHHRWPIIHRPSLDGDLNSPLMLLPMKMIGAWIVGTAESKQYALAMHEVLMEKITPQLHRINSHDKFQQTLSNGLCVSALLNIIFSLYHGSDQVVSRAATLRNVLVAALREVGLFQSETAWADEQPGFFLPMRTVMTGQRQRLASYLFKVDTFLGVLRNQPSLLTPEELHFTLPWSFAVWNSDGLHIWEERHVAEPAYRSQMSLFNLIDGNSSDSGLTAEQPMLIEDVQTCLCAAQSDIWRLTQRPGPSKDHETNTVCRKECLRRRLDVLKSRLDQMGSQIPGHVEIGQAVPLDFRYYYGFEDQSQPDWEYTVNYRVKSLLFDTSMLYYLLSLHLCADIRMFTQLAKDQHLGSIEKASELHRQAREERKLSSQIWAATSDARRALWGAANILTSHQATKQCKDTDKRTFDPITHVALCAAALVVWAFCRSSDHGCNICYPGAPSVIELTTLNGQGDTHKEAWIVMGATCRPQLQGIQLCGCNLEFLMSLFQACLPDGWGVADMIAPGVLKQLI